MPVAVSAKRETEREWSISHCESVPEKSIWWHFITISEDARTRIRCSRERVCWCKRQWVNGCTLGSRHCHYTPHALTCKNDKMYWSASNTRAQRCDQRKCLWIDEKPSNDIAQTPTNSWGYMPRELTQWVIACSQSKMSSCLLSNQMLMCFCHWIWHTHTHNSDMYLRIALVAGWRLVWAIGKCALCYNSNCQVTVVVCRSFV